MLIELLTLAKNLKAQGVEAGLVHRDFFRPGTSSHTTLRAVLDEEGRLVRLLPIAREDQELWTLRKGNFKYFPSVRSSKKWSAPPICWDMDDERWEDLEKTLGTEELRNLFLTCEGELQGIDLSDLEDQVARLDKWVLLNRSEVVERLACFAIAFRRFASNPRNAAQEVFHVALQALDTQCSDSLRTQLTTLLFGQRKKRKSQESTREYPIQLCFDISLRNDPAFSLYTPKVRNVVLQCLQSEQPQGDRRTADTRCALTGKSAPLLSGPFPSWSVPPVISKPLNVYSKFSEAACNFRYHRADSDAFPIAEDAANQVVAALKAITDLPPGVNWRPLYSGKFEKRKETRDVLVVFPTIPIQDLRIADIFGPTDSEDGRKQFQDEARPVCEAFAKVSQQDAVAPYLVILLVRQISPGQIQLAYSAMPSIGDFSEAIASWNASGNNLPPGLRIPLPSKNAPSGIGRFKPALMFPEQIVRMLMQAWIRDGTECVRQEAPAIGSVLDLFLRRPGIYKEAAESLLDIVLARNAVLLTKAGHVLHRDNLRPLELWRHFVSSARPLRPDYALSQTISLMGSLLYIMNSNVENYVNEAAFLVGRLLAGMDELHKCYCIAMRQGDIPNALIGNGFLGRAAESPARALEELSERSRVYLGWAKSADPLKANSERVRIAIHSARKVLRIVAPLCERLHAESSLEQVLEPVQRAHLFLGYLSPVLGKDEDADIAESLQADESAAPK